MEKFFLGVDIGTNSVGMACTDEDYNLLRAKGKDCWSVRLFDESETAAERRTYRSNRRRLQRRKYRIGLLQELFAPFIEDKTFFIRLNNSQFLPEDKDCSLSKDTNTLFNDPAYTDKDFHKEFPTIYHLRKALLGNKKYDLRFYYLAIHHIIKYRGHFLFEGSTGEIRNAENLFIALNDCCENIYGAEGDIPHFDPSLTDDAKAIFLNDKKGIRDKQKDLEVLFGVASKTAKEIVKGMCGATFSTKTLFGEGGEKQESISFKTLTDEKLESLRTELGDNFALVECMHSVYSFMTFEKLLEGQPNISSAMIAVYDKHKADLKLLKDFLRQESRDKYNKILKSTTEKANYVNYIGYTKKGGEKKFVKGCKDEEFLKHLKTEISSIDAKDTKTKELILTKIESGDFLPKILHSDNGSFPHQVNEDELKNITAKMVEFYPETTEMSKKLEELFKFRVPYYVGPLTGIKSWAVRNSDEKITPWNIREVIDHAKSNEEFMRRMTNKCSILHTEDVLPKCSIIYQKYNVLNQINKLKVNDVPLSDAKIKQTIYNELFLKYSKVSDKKIIELLVKIGYISKDAKDVAITGKNGELSASMSSYIALKKILGDFVDDKNNAEILENIILWITLNTDKKIVEDLILSHYGKISAIKNNIKLLKGLTFKDFGRLSKKLLVGLAGVNKETGEVSTIMDLLYNTNQNLNEILYNEKYNFTSLIAEENGEESKEITYKDIEELYVSPAVRRGIWQSLIMADEYINAIGKMPDKVFIEVTREKDDKHEQKASRKKRLLELYKGITEGAYQDVIEELNREDMTDLKLRGERLYLYFRQLGRCAYSGKRINLDDLLKPYDTTYDVDHILPRTYTKDDSLDNKVLVLRTCNQTKTDIYPVPEDLRQEKLWALLYEKKLFSKTTYDRLMRIKPLGEEDYNDFINRQKVITDQTVKAVAELMARKYPETKIVYSKSKNVSDFKNKFDLFKCRETNDLHHARDAYLNIVVGNVFDTCFTPPMSFHYRKGDGWREYNLKKLFTKDIKGAWDGSSLSRVKTTYFKHTMSISQYSYCNNGEFYNQTIYGKDDDSITAPRKGSGPLRDTSKYGGYKSQSTAYFAIVLSKDKKDQPIKTIEAVPVLTSYRQKKDPNALLDYFATYLTDPKILLPKLKLRQLISYNGTPVYIAGITENSIIVHNAVELFTDNKTDEYINQLTKLVELSQKGSLKDSNEYIIKTNRNQDVKITVNSEKNTALFEMLEERLSKHCYQGISPYKNFKGTLNLGKDSFKKLSVISQAKVLLQILKFFKCNAETSDLSLMSDSKSGKPMGAFCGKIRFGKNITDVDFQIISKSPAGLTVRVKKV